MIPAATSASTAASSSGSVSWPPQRARNASQAPAKHFFFSHISCPNFSKNLSRHNRLTTQRYFENVEILLTLTDGTVIDLSNAGGSIGPEDGVTVCSKGEVFSEVLPMEDMASISVGGVVYDLTVE